MKIQPTSKDSVHKQALDWLILMNSEHCSDLDRHDFNVWLETSMHHQQAYETLRAQWEWMERFKAINFPAREAALSHRHQSPRRFYRSGIAASVLLVLGICAFLPMGWIGIPQTYMTEKGGHQTISLSDGSSIELNTDSEVRVHYNYWHRNVEMIKGEAFFTVAHNEKRPFEVRASGGHLKDLGTAFDVYIKPEQVIVAVEEGIVEVQLTEKRKLIAGQQLAYNNSGVLQTLQPKDVTELTTWRQGKLVFRDRRLDAVLTEIARYHDTHIILQDESLGALRVSGTFYTEKLNDFVGAITSILPVKVAYVTEHEIFLK